MKFKPRRWKFLKSLTGYTIDPSKSLSKLPLIGEAYFKNAGVLYTIQGTTDVKWKAYYEKTDSSVRITNLFDYSGILFNQINLIDLDLEFDSQGRPVVLFSYYAEEWGNTYVYVKIRYYKSSVNAYVIDNIGNSYNAPYPQITGLVWVNKDSLTDKDLLAIYDDGDGQANIAKLSTEFVTDWISVRASVGNGRFISAVNTTSGPSNLDNSVIIKAVSLPYQVVMKFNGPNGGIIKSRIEGYDSEGNWGYLLNAEGEYQFTGNTSLIEKYLGKVTKYSDKFTNQCVISTTDGNTNGVLSIESNTYQRPLVNLVNHTNLRSNHFILRTRIKIKDFDTNNDCNILRMDRFDITIPYGRNYFKISNFGWLPINNISVVKDEWMELAIVGYGHNRVSLYVNGKIKDTAFYDSGWGDSITYGTYNIEFINYGKVCYDYIEMLSHDSERWSDNMAPKLAVVRKPVSSSPNNLLLLLDLKDNNIVDSSSYNRDFGVIATPNHVNFTKNHCPYFGDDFNTYAEVIAGVKTTRYYYKAKLRLSSSSNDFKNLNGWLMSAWVYKDNDRPTEYNDGYPLFSMSNENPQQINVMSPGTQGAFISGAGLAALANANSYYHENQPIWVRGNGLANPTIIWSNIKLLYGAWNLIEYLYLDNYLTILVNGIPAGGGDLPGGILETNGALMVGDSYQFPSGTGPGASQYVSTGFQFWRLNNQTDMDNLELYRGSNIVQKLTLQPFVY